MREGIPRQEAEALPNPSMVVVGSARLTCSVFEWHHWQILESLLSRVYEELSVLAVSVPTTVG